MRRPRSAALAAAAALLAALVPSPVVADRTDPVTSARAEGASLSASPARFVGGQALTWSGSLGVAGVRPITLQQHMGRPGDQWFAVPGFRGQTAADGSFRFQFPAPGMQNISYRVRGGTHVSPKVLLAARSQDVVLWAVGGSATNPGYARAGQPFTVTADTTPVLARRPDLQGTPVLAGRGLTLQRRVDGDTWQQVASSTVGSDGKGYFKNVVAPAAGTVVYRVRLEDWTRDGSRIGWYPSFPTPVTVVAPGAAAPRVEPTSTRTTYVAPAPRSGGTAASATASGTYKWGPQKWDYAWERGESLTSPPQNGVGSGWSDFSNGTGRASKQNGGLFLVSGRNNTAGPGDRGTTAVTARGGTQAYGRWELRFRTQVLERDQANYRLRAQLVPADPGAGYCGERDITIADIASGGTVSTFGARAGALRWTGRARVGTLEHAAPALAVEVSRTVITWFVNGRPVGRVANTKAVSGEAMTLKISLVGAGTTERDHTSLISDWQRAYDIGPGQQSPAAPLLRAGTAARC